MTPTTTGPANSAAAYTYCQHIALSGKCELEAAISDLLIRQSTPETFSSLLEDIRAAGCETGVLKKLFNPYDTRAFFFCHYSAIEAMRKSAITSYHPFNLDRIVDDLASNMAWWAVEVFAAEIQDHFDLAP